MFLSFNMFLYCFDIVYTVLYFDIFFLQICPVTSGYRFKYFLESHKNQRNLQCKFILKEECINISDYGTLTILSFSYWR